MARSKEEHQIQKACVQWFNLQRFNSVLFACPNGGSRHKLEAVRLKQEGVLAGVSDLIHVYDGGVQFIEVKTPKGKQQDTQKEFENNVTNLGHSYYVVRSVYEFIDVIKKAPQ